MAHHAPEPHFEQSLRAVFRDIQGTCEDSNAYRLAMLLYTTPEVIHQFRIIWQSEPGRLDVYRGFCINYHRPTAPSGAFQGLIRFHPTANLDSIRCLGYEQLLRSSQVPDCQHGTLVAGADFDATGRTEAEILEFCSHFAKAAKQYSSITPTLLVADVGVSEAMLDRCRSHWQVNDGATTAKGPAVVSPALANARALLCYSNLLLQLIIGRCESVKNKKIAISGSGKLALEVARTALELEAIVVSLSDRRGCVVQHSGFLMKDIEKVRRGKCQGVSLAASLRESLRGKQASYYAGQTPWKHVSDVDIALPCAFENELTLDDAESLINKSGTEYVLEGSTMSCTAKAADLLIHRIHYAPSRATTSAVIQPILDEQASRRTGIPWDDQTWWRQISEASSTYFARHVEALSQDKSPASHLVSDDRSRRKQPDIARGSCLTAIRTLITSTAKLMEPGSEYTELGDRR